MRAPNIRSRYDRAACNSLARAGDSADSNYSARTWAAVAG